MDPLDHRQTSRAKTLRYGALVNKKLNAKFDAILSSKTEPVYLRKHTPEKIEAQAIGEFDGDTKAYLEHRRRCAFATAIRRSRAYGYPDVHFHDASLNVCRLVLHEAFYELSADFFIETRNEMLSVWLQKHFRFSGKDVNSFVETSLEQWRR